MDRLRPPPSRRGSADRALPLLPGEASVATGAAKSAGARPFSRRPQRHQPKRLAVQSDDRAPPLQYAAKRRDLARWCGKVKSVEPAGEGQWQVLHKPVPLRPAIELTLEHLEVRPSERLTLREEDEASAFEVEYRLEPSAVGTRFTQISEFRWKKLPRVLHRTFARSARGQLQALKRVLEKLTPCAGSRSR